MPDLSEADFQRRVMDAARAHGWRVAHFRPAMTQRGRWVTPMAGDTGFPDLVLAKGGLVLLAELKTDTGRATPAQEAWLSAVGGHGRLWRPKNWEAVLLDLAGRAASSAEFEAERRQDLAADAASGEGETNA